MRHLPPRRRLLRGLAAGLGGLLAGCPTPTDRRTTPSAPASSPEGTSTPTSTRREPTATPTDGRVVILTDYAGEPWQDRWEGELAPRLEDELGIDVRPTYLGFSVANEIRSRVEWRIEEGDAHESVTGTLWTTDVGYLLAHGRFDPVTTTVEALTGRNGDLVGEPATVLGEHYVVPHGTYVDTIHYRADVLERLGLDQPDTLGTLLHNAEVLDGSGEVDHGFPVPTGAFPERFFKLILNAHGAHLWRRADGEDGEAEVWFPESEVRDALSYVRELAGYSPDPQESLQPHVDYLWGSVAQMHFLNGWGAGLAAYGDRGPGIARNTEIVPFPTKEGVEPFARSYPGFDGFAAVGEADNVPGLLAVLRWMYADPERVARYYEPRPARYVPPYAEVMETDAYRGIELFQRYPHLLELNRNVRDGIVPLEATSEELVLTPATAYAEDFGILRDMVRRVLVEGRTIEDAIGIARGALEWRLEEGRRIAGRRFRHEK